MKIRFNIGLIALALLYATNSFSQAPKYSNEFLNIGVGARALGMANAFTAITDDGSAGYWNPAGLTHLRANLQLSLMHAQYFAGIARYDNGSLAFRSGEEHFFSFTVIRFGVDDIPDTSELIDAEGNINYDRIRSFSASDNAFLFSYARTFPALNNLRFGASAKVIRRTAGTFANAWGFGLDVGLQYQIGNWRFAAVGRDITTTFNAWSYQFDDRMREVFTLTGNRIPESSLELTMPRLILGAARQLYFTEALRLMASVDLVITTDGRRNVLIPGDPFSIEPNLGFELSYNNLIFIRAGAGNIQRHTQNDMQQGVSVQFNMGLGINLGERLSIDYALANAGNQNVALYSNIFSLRYSIERRNQQEPD
ncbi:MAG TPA: PorV/PorQ family protein [Bacteroidales bacterium]|nr:PorV/PorQ family protein [Bacteroidales bacterium]